MDYKDKSGSGYRVDRLKQIWRGQDVVLVEGKDSRLVVGNDLFEGANSLVRVLGPSENAFDRYDEIMNYVKTNANQNTLILLALGPTATALAYELLSSIITPLLNWQRRYSCIQHLIRFGTELREPASVKDIHTFTFLQ